MGGGIDADRTPGRDDDSCAREVVAELSPKKTTPPTAPLTLLTPEQVEQLARLKTGLLELTSILDNLGTIPRGPERNSIGWVLHGFSLAAVRAWSPPKKPRNPRQSKGSVTDGWIGG